MEYEQTPIGTAHIRLVWGLCLLAVLIPLQAQADKTIIMAFGGDPEREPQYRFYQAVYTEAFAELGYQFAYTLCPSKRCSYLANAGKVDGEPQRIREYSERFDQLVRVDEPIFINRTLGVLRDRTLRFEGLESLKDSGYRVDYLRGSVWSQEHLSSVVAPERLFAVANAEQGLKRLRLNRTDLFIDLEAHLMKVLQTPEFIREREYPRVLVGANESFPFLHVSRSSLAPQLAEVLRTMKADGRYQALLYQTMPYLDPREANR